MIGEDMHILREKIDQICVDIGHIKKSQAQATSERAAIMTALVGNELGTTGVIKRVATVEEKVEAITRKHIRWAGVAVGVSLAAGLIRDWMGNALHIK